jgi:hypothetical protein
MPVSLAEHAAAAEQMQRLQDSLQETLNALQVGAWLAACSPGLLLEFLCSALCLV